MLKNYLKIAIRTLLRQKTYAAINISGLALGLAVALVIGMFIRHKLSYDHYHPEVERLYRVIQTAFACSPPGLAKALEDRYPEFEVITEVSNPGRYLIGKTPDEAFYISGIITADEHFFRVFPYQALLGNPEAMLNRPGQIVLTRSLARQLFGDENPLGHSLTVEAKSQYEITGVIKDVPPNSHFRFQAILSLTREGRQVRFGETVRWAFYGDYLYTRLHPNTDPAALEAKMTAWANANHPYEPKNFGLYLQPVTEIHLHSELRNEIAPQSDIRYLYFFAALAMVVLAVVCFNYMNLATARSMQRRKEIGVRKVCGAQRPQLIRQFLAESLLFSLIALPLAIGIAETAIPAINNWAGEIIAPRLSFDIPALATLFGIVLLTGLAAGSYPALFLSAFRPATILGKIATAAKGGLLRKVFVISQFAVTVMLVFVTVTICSQLDFIRNKRLGFEKDYVVTFASNFLGEKYQAFKQTLLQSPHILAVSSGIPAGIGYKNMTTSVVPADSGRGFMLGFLRIDYDYLETLGLALQAGRTFSPDYATDADDAAILNEAAVQKLALADDPVGMIFGRSDRKWRVIGVVADFHNNSLKSQVQPIAFALSPGANWHGLVRLDPKNVQAGLTVLQKAWEQFVPERPFEFTFLSDRIARQYRAEERLADIFIFFSALAIFIACLGLFGLASFSAEQRTKEIGVRKVLGASVTGIIALLSRDFSKWVLLANLIAWPIAWLAMNQWLQNFAYRIEMSWLVFALAGGLALAIALLTVSTQAVKAALANPVESLRYE